MTMAKYLPSVNVYYTYSKYHEIDNKIKLDKENEQTFGSNIKCSI